MIDGSGRFLIPGLWDMHVHAWAPSPFSEIYLRHGITGLREMGTGIDPQWGGSQGVWDWRAAVRARRMPGPRIFAAGFILNGGSPEQQGAVFFKGVETREDARRWVDSLAARAADFIKVYSALAPEAFEAIAQRARERGLWIGGHVPARVGTLAAIRQGLRSVEHLYDFLVSTSSEETRVRTEIERHILESEIATAAAQLAELERSDLLIETYDPAKARELVAALVEHGTWVVPTLIVTADPRCANLPLEPTDSASLARLPRFLRRFVELPETPQEEIERSCRRFEKLGEIVGELERAGVRIVTGSDAPNPGVPPGTGLHEELVLLVRAGLTPLRALQAATRDAAEFVGAADSLGTVETGKLADLVLLEADPLEDIRNTRRIAAVVVNGTVIVDVGQSSGARDGAGG